MTHEGKETQRGQKCEERPYPNNDWPVDFTKASDKKQKTSDGD